MRSSGAMRGEFDYSDDTPGLRMIATRKATARVPTHPLLIPRLYYDYASGSPGRSYAPG